MAVGCCFSREPFDIVSDNLRRLANDMEGEKKKSSDTGSGNRDKPEEPEEPTPEPVVYLITSPDAPPRTDAEGPPYEWHRHHQDRDIVDYYRKVGNRWQIYYRIDIDQGLAFVVKGFVM